MLSKRQKVEKEGAYLNNYLRVMEGNHSFRSGFIAMYTKLGYPNNIDAPSDLTNLFERACEQERFPDFGAINPNIEASAFKTMDESELMKYRKQFVAVSSQDSTKTVLEMSISCRTAYMMAMLDEELRVRHKARVPLKPVDMQNSFLTPLKSLVAKSTTSALSKEDAKLTDEEIKEKYGIADFDDEA